MSATRAQSERFNSEGVKQWIWIMDRNLLDRQRKKEHSMKHKSMYEQREMNQCGEKKNLVLEAIVWVGFEKDKGFSSLPKTTFTFWFLLWDSEIL